MKKKALISILATTMLMTACNSASVPLENTTISETTSVMTTETTAEPTPTPVVYSFSWTNKDSTDFAQHFEEKCGCEMRRYIRLFGFTEELSETLTEYVNSKYNTDYETIPFSEVSYFHTYVVDKESGHQDIRESYDKFSGYCLYRFDAPGVLANQLIISYLYQNQLPLGTRISLDYLEELGVEDIYTYNGIKYIMYNYCFDLGSYDSSYEYSNYELLSVLELYNIQIWELCNDERIKNLDLLTDDPEFPQAAEAREIYNSFLREYYGFDNCPQFGELVTREQYIEIFGEEPLDLSYIPGAVVN